VTDKTGILVAILGVTDEEDLMIINKSGVAIRTSLDKLRTMGRATQGVRLISLKGKDEIAAVCKTPKEEEDDRDFEEAPETAE
jgi:DNA gyrase subunit A